MKGIIFTTLNEMVEKKYGMEVWETLLEKTHPPSEGIYTVGQIYEDTEFSLLINGLSKLLNLDPKQLIEEFGIYTFPVLARKYPSFIPADITLKDFLKSIDGIIHVEVKKLYPEANLPELRYDDVSPNQLAINYTSPRKLCHLAIGLIKGAAKFFHHTVNINHPLCMHKGSDYCRLEITIGKYK